MRWLGVAVAVLGACGDNAPPADVNIGGTRLQARFLVDEEGDRQFVAWHDRELEVDCAWSSGDSPHCVPSIPTAEIYEDGDCSRPLATVGSSPCEKIPRRVSAVDHLAHVDACGTEPASNIYTVGAVTTANPIYAWVNGTCTPQQRQSGTTYYATSNPLGADALVGGKIVNTGNGRVLARTILGEDGSYAPAGAYDTSLESPCTLDTERMECVPAYWSTNLAEDSMCQRPIVGALAACAPPPYIGVAHDQLRLWHRGDLLTSDPSQTLTFYDMSILVVATGWSCTPKSGHVLPGYALYHAGDELSADEISPVTRTLGDGKRLQPYVLRSDDYHELDTSSGTLFDRQLGIDCRPTQIDDTTWRCLPELLHGFPMFGDAACTMPMLVAFGRNDVTAGPVLVSEQIDACTNVQHLHALGAPLSAMSLYWQSSDGSCRPFTTDPSEQLYSVGVELTFDAYARLTVR